MTAPRTLPELLRDRASSGRGVVEILGVGGAPLRLDPAALEARARGALAGLQARGARPGDAVLVCLPDPAAFVSVFWGCQLGGLVPVPVAPPVPGADEDDARRLAAIARRMGAPPVVCPGFLASEVTSRTRGPAWPAEEVLAGDAAAARPATVSPDALALIQFSSGSTGAPRGVCLTQRSVLANLAQVRARGLRPDDLELSWMPLHHDMGLIACHLASLEAGAHQLIMPTLQLLAAPATWLDLATTRRATVLTATTTALEFVLRRLRKEPASRWDLSPVRAVFVGAEPVLPRTLRAFQERFAPAGLVPDVCRPAYGLAEACVGVAAILDGEPLRVHRLSRRALAEGRAEPAQEDGDTLEIPETGPPLPDTELRVVDDGDAPLPDGRVGHVQVRGPQVMAGYHDDPEATGAAFAGDWLRTGDLGFLREGRLTLCGRSRETFIVAGRKVYAADVEAVAAEEPGVRRAVACRVPGTEPEEVLLCVVPEARWPDPEALLEAARRRVHRVLRLPVQHVALVENRRLPRTSSGKLRRFRLAERFREGSLRGVRTPPSPPAAPDLTALETRIRAVWARVLGLEPARVGRDDTFLELGGSSLKALEVAAGLEEELGRVVSVELVLRSGTVREQAAVLAGASPGPGAAPGPAPGPAEGEVAVVGLSCRFPGGADPGAWWDLLRTGASALGGLPPGRWPPEAWAGIRCRAGGFLPDPWAFDAAFFGMGPAEARMLDPQQRVLLELSVEALEQAGWGRRRRQGHRVGVWIGAGPAGHLEALQGLLARGEAPRPDALVGSLVNMLAARIAHVLDLHGPAMTVDTACSSSLVALHLAAASLRRGECDLAVVGGASLPLTPSVYRLFEAAGALSPTGQSLVFAHGADGFVPGEGAGVVLLRRLEDARADADPILARVLASAVNNDGRSLSPMVPGPGGQVDVLRGAWRGLDPARLALVEAHGTATPIGDAAELGALHEFLGGAGARGVAVGSVKANVGHLLAAAGLAGLLKVVLALRAGVMPPAPHAGRPDPRHGLHRGILRLLERPEPWPAEGLAAVSSLGFGGTNAHVVLAPAPPARSRPAPPLGVLPVSAPTPAHLDAWLPRLAAAPDALPELAGRTAWPVRRARVLEAGEAAAAALADPTGWHQGTTRRPPRVALLFPGQGALHPFAGAGLLAAWPAARARFQALCGRVVGVDLPALLLGEDGGALHRTDRAQPLGFALQVALAEELRALGVPVVVVLGHSVGELAAATVAGALDAEATLDWVAARGALMHALAPGGGMGAVVGGPERLAAVVPELPDGVTVAAFNGPDQCVVAGPVPALGRLRERLATAGVGWLPLPTSCAFHSPAMDPVVEALGRVPPLEARTPAIPLVSTVTTHTIRAFPDGYWARHAREPVRFAEALETLARDHDVDVFLEVGPGAVLGGLARRVLAGDPRPVLSLGRVAGARDPAADVRVALEALARLWVAGAELDWERLQPSTRAGRLPAVPWRRGSFRLDRPEPAGDLLHVPAWREAGAVPAATLPAAGWTWILPPDRAGPPGACRATGRPGDAFSRASDLEVTLDPTRADHLGWLLRLAEEPAGVVADVRGVPLPEALPGLARLADVLLRNPVPLRILAGDETPDDAAAGQFAAALLEENPRLEGRVLVARADVPVAVLAEECRRPGPRILAVEAARRLEPGFAPAPASASPALPRPEGARVLVTGGWGGLGRLLVDRLLEAGAASVVVAGRRSLAAVGPEVEAAGAGSRLRYVQADVGDGAEVARLLEACGPLDVVVHAAGVAVPGRATRVDGAAVSAVLGPKLEAAGHLARLLDPSVRVILLSSMAGSIPWQARGLALYGAANAGLDALARQQVGRGRPWTSLAWARWAGVGMGGGEDAAAVHARSGLLSLAPREALEAWDRAWDLRAPVVLVAPAANLRITPPTAAPPPAAAGPAPLPPSFPPPSSPPAASPLASSPCPEPGPTEVPAPPAAAPATGRPPGPEEIERFLREQLGRALGIPPDRVSRTAPFQTLGLESLAAVEIMKRLEAFLGRPLSLTLLFEHDSIARVLPLLAPPDGGEAPPEPEGRVGDPAPPPGDVEAGPLPVLPSQATFVVNQAFAPDIPNAVIVRVALEGPVDPACLDQALRHLFQRHVMLRVVLVLEEGRLVQRAGGFPCPAVEVADPGEADAVLERLMGLVFPLDRGPLFHLALVREGPDRATLLWSLHHAVADAWSAGILLRELLTVHGQLRAGQPPRLPPLRTTVARCVEALQGEPDAASLAWWRQVLDPPPPPLRLPYDGDPDAPPRGPARMLVVPVAGVGARELREAAARWDLSLFQLLLLAWNNCLRDRTGQDDVTVRVAHARRDVRVDGIEEVVGAFADSLPVRLRAGTREGGDDAARGRALRTALLEARRHGGVSSMALARLQGAGRVAGPRGVSAAGMSFPGFVVPERFGEVRIRGFAAGFASGFTQVGLVAWERGDRVETSWNWLAPLFREETIRDLARAYEEELVRLVRGPPGSGLAERLLGRLEAGGSRVVVASREGERDAATVRAHALRVAWDLAARGAGRGERVAVVARPGLQVPAVLVGILATGAAWVPVDPDQPDARIASVLALARCRWAFCAAEDLPRLAGLAGLEAVLLLDEAGEPPGAVPWRQVLAAPHRDLPATRAGDEAYVLTTSGTTGQPRGVRVTHGALARFLDWVQERLGLGPGDRLIQLSSLAFGASLRQVFSPVLSGAVGVPAPRGLTRDPDALADFLAEQRITVWNSTPTLWARLLQALEARPVPLPALRWVLVGGEPLPGALVRRWQARVPGPHRIVNVYGGAETVTNVASWEVTTPPPADVPHVPIGVPRPDVQLRVVDPEGRPCAEGEVGELWVGGPGLALGYLDDPEATAAAFPVLPEGRFFRTGDLARRDGDRFTVLGRRDAQVKIRGNRVELAEIEGALRTFPGVRDAVVRVAEVDGRQRVTAFLLADGPGPAAAAVRAHLATQLPEWMIPHRFRTLADWPLNANGKVDRRALDRWPEEPGTTDEAPPEDLTPTQALVARTWCTVLGLPQVGLHDDFFQLGGDSLLALDVLQRLGEVLPAIPRPVILYTERTVARLAAALDALPAGDTAPPTPGPAAVGQGSAEAGVLPLAPAQAGFLLSARLRGGSAHWVADLPVEGRVDPERLVGALARCVERHPLLRTVFPVRDLRTVQQVLPPAVPPVTWEDLRDHDAPEEALRERFEEERARPFRPDAWPLFRLRACRLGETRWRWLVSAHHAIGDAWSLQVLLEDLLAFHDDRPPPPLGASFADVVQRPVPPATEADRAFWRGVLAPVPDAGLPRADGPPRELRLDPATLARLRAAARRRRTTLHTLLLGTVFRVLARVAGPGPRVVGTALHGRDLPLPGVDRVFGPLARALPVRAAVGGEDVEADLAAVARAFEDGCRHGDVDPYALLRAEAPAALAEAPGQAFFFSYMEIPPPAGGSLRIGLEEARTTFQAEAAEVMVTARAGRGLHLAVQGAAAPDVRERVRQALEADLAALGAAPGPAGPGSGRVRGPEGGGSLDAAIVAYLPTLGGAARQTGLPEPALAALVEAVFPREEPRLVERLHTRFGTSGAIFLPRTADAVLAGPEETLARQVADAVAVAADHGARVVSLAGMLPSRTGYLFRVLEELARRGAPRAGAWPVLTTGHAATVVAVVGTVERLLARSGRAWGELRVGVVGLGSIGQAAIHRLLDRHGAPAGLRVFEVQERLAALAEPLAVLEDRAEGRFRVSVAGEGLPEEAYACDLLVGASGRGGILDVARLRPGSMVADDSFPPLWDPEAARRRAFEVGDVVLSGAGLLDLGPVASVLEPALPPVLGDRLPGSGPGVPGCRAESLLLAGGLDLPPVHGLVTPPVARAWQEALAALGCGAASLHLGDQPYPGGGGDRV